MFLAVSSPNNEEVVPADVVLLLSPRSVVVTCTDKGMPWILPEEMLTLSGVIGLSISPWHLHAQVPMMLEDEEFLH